MELANILEAIMLICFGASWPFSIVKSFRIKMVKGKSPFFLALILAGYVAGIGKILAAYFAEKAKNPEMCIPLPWLIWFYIGLFVLVSIDTALYFRYRNNK